MANPASSVFLAAALVAIAATLSGCGPKPELISYAKCRASESDRAMSVYLTPNGAAATCYPTEAAIYMTCVRDLAVVETSWHSEQGTDLRVVAPGVPGVPEASLKIANDVATKYAAEGKLAEARANALQHCAKLAESAQGK